MKKEKAKNKLKRQNGITLIALVVTIIVLIILAVISVNLVFNEGGIISKAEKAKLVARAGNLEDEIEMWKADKNIAKNIKSTSENESDMLNRLRESNLITSDDEVDTINRVIKVKNGNGDVVREISYNTVKININKIPIVEEDGTVKYLLKVSSFEGIERSSTPITEDNVAEFYEIYEEMLKAIPKLSKEQIINLCTKGLSSATDIYFSDFSEVFNYMKNHYFEFPYDNEEAYAEHIFLAARGEEDRDYCYYGPDFLPGMGIFNESHTCLECYLIKNPLNELSDAYLCSEKGTYTFTIEDLLTGNVYTSSITIDELPSSMDKNYRALSIIGAACLVPSNTVDFENPVLPDAFENEEDYGNFIDQVKPVKFDYSYAVVGNSLVSLDTCTKLSEGINFISSRDAVKKINDKGIRTITIIIMKDRSWD